MRLAGRSIRRAVFVAAAASLVLLFGAWRLHDSRTFQVFGTLVSSVATTDSVVALTFDDGPSVYTDSVLDFLRREGVRATFFVVGESLAHNPDLGRQIVAAGHELGNHSYSHQRMVFKPPRFIRREVESTDSAIRRAGHRGPIHFRPPYGKRLFYLPWYLASTNRTTVMWSLEPDTRFRSADAIADHVERKVRPGMIIVLHVEVPSRNAERAALRRIVPELKRRGYEFVTVSELIRRGG